MRSTDLFDHPTEREVLTVLGAASELDVGKARLLLEQAALTREDFHLPAHAALFEFSASEIRNGRPVGLVSASAALKGNTLVPAQLIAEIFSAVPGPDFAVTGHALTLRALSVKRKALGILRELQAQLLRPGSDVEAVIGEGGSQWAALTTGRADFKTGREVAEELRTEVRANANGTATRCIPTGIDVWDQVFGGLECGHLTFIGSQPSVGKGKLFATWVDNLAHAGTKVGVFSLEDGGTWLPRRQVARSASIPNFVLAKKRLGTAQLERFESAVDTLDRHGGLDYLMDDRRMLTPAQIVARARDWCVNHNVKAILLDHMGKVDWQASSHHRHDLAIAHGLALFSKLAHDYKIPFVIAAHTKRTDGLGRGEDPRTVRPRLSDFALASWIERDARVAAGLYLPTNGGDFVLVANLKQTNGTSDDDFPIKEIRGAAMLASENGVLAGNRYESEEQQMLGLGSVKP